MELLQTTVDAAPVLSRDIFIEELYEETFPMFARYTSKRNGTFQHTRDVFHDALLIYIEKSLTPGFAVKTSHKAYVFGIAKYLWIRKFHRDIKQVPFELAGEKIDVPPDYFPDKREIGLLNFLEKTGKKCMDLLQKFYFEKSSLKQIASSLGYRTEHSAAVQKFKCIGKIRDVLKERSIGYEDFVN